MVVEKHLDLEDLKEMVLDEFYDIPGEVADAAAEIISNYFEGSIINIDELYDFIRHDLVIEQDQDIEEIAMESNDSRIVESSEGVYAIYI